MNLPAIVIAYADRWKVRVSGSTSADNGTPMPITRISAISACHARRDSSAGRGGKPSAKPDNSARCSSLAVARASTPVADALAPCEPGEVTDVISGLRAAALEGEHALRAFLDKQHDQHEHGDLREHGAPERFDCLADET